MRHPIYLDYNATTPIDTRVAEAMRPYIEQQFGNPSSMHAFGIIAKKAVEQARRQVASLLGCYPDEIVFTSGGTESNNYAIKGIALHHRHKGNHIITTAIEHPAVTEVCHFLETQGIRVSYIPVDAFGMVSPADIAKAITPQTILISVMHANNEVGTILPIKEIAHIAQNNHITFHTDAAQSVGKIPVHVNELGVDLLSLAGHKLYAPKGIGALFIRRGTELQKLMHGAGHEHNLRAGTENVSQIVGLGAAAELAAQTMATASAHMKKCTDLLLHLLQASLPDMHVNGHPEYRLPNTLSVSFPAIEANTLLDELHMIAASAGAACHADSVQLSTVLEAMHVPIDIAMGTVRFSTGRNTTEQDISEAAHHIVAAVSRLKPASAGEPIMVESPDSGPIRLTKYTHGMGCACKIRPQYLEQILKDLPVISDSRVLTGPEHSDDAAVFKINDDTAIVQTVDFFTPIVDDPYHFGAIAAANALSDIYAMGARPLFALNIVGFPSNRLPMKVLKDILKGASDKAAEAGICILGGHTVEDTEPKFGMVVTGSLHPEKIMTNAGAQAGDALILTKPIGTGIISTAVKRGLADDQTMQDALNTMLQLNDKAASLMEHFPVNACTDITGFGLLGHLKEMATASKIVAEIDASRVPLIEGAYELAVAGTIPGGTKNNLEYVNACIQWPTGFPQVMKWILCDAQTSGGLLVALPEKFAREYIDQLFATYAIKACLIGRVIESGNGSIIVI